jgi:hypothetical protein
MGIRREEIGSEIYSLDLYKRGSVNHESALTCTLTEQTIDLMFNVVAPVSIAQIVHLHIILTLSQQIQ